MKKAAYSGWIPGLAAVGFWLTGCGGDPLAAEESMPSLDEISSALYIDPGPPVVPNIRGVVASVTGNGHIEGLRSYTFTAFRHADGESIGWVHGRARGRDSAELWVTVDCLNVIDNEAWIGGMVLISSDPTEVGEEYSFMVVDNDMYPGVPDQVGEHDHGHDCMEAIPHETRPLTIGNLHVRGG